jgi:hypothetical protein
MQGKGACAACTVCVDSTNMANKAHCPGLHLQQRSNAATRQRGRLGSQWLTHIVPPSASVRSTVMEPCLPNTMWRAQLIHGFFSMTPGGQKALVILRLTSA